MRFLVITFCYSLVMATLIVANHNMIVEQNLRNEWKKIKVIPPDTPPSQDQESIELALVMFGIDIPSNVEHPRFNPNLEDRGITIVKPMNKFKVEIGPSAYTTWGLLGSTLAHEIEVHCRQKSLYLSFLIGSERMVNALEKEAYDYEINSADRFSLTPNEVSLIKSTKRFYYGE